MKAKNVHGTMTRPGMRACPMFSACTLLVRLAGCGCDDTTATHTDGDVHGGESDSAAESTGDPAVDDCSVTTVGPVRPSNVEGIDFGCWITP
jgi:hypothetical protein